LKIQIELSVGFLELRDVVNSFLNVWMTFLPGRSAFAWHEWLLFELEGQRKQIAGAMSIT